MDREGRGLGEFQGLSTRSNCSSGVKVSKFKDKGTEVLTINEVVNVC